ncbi:hypothetical protein ACWOA5_07975 [Granulicatella adiacens]
MKTRNELIEYFTESLEYEDKNIIVDELKETYNETHSNYRIAEEKLQIYYLLKNLIIMIPQRLI